MLAPFLTPCFKIFRVFCITCSSMIFNVFCYGLPDRFFFYFWTLEPFKIVLSPTRGAYSRKITFSRKSWNLTFSWSILALFLDYFSWNFLFFSASIFALIFYHIFDGKWSQNGSQNRYRYSLLAPFWLPFAPFSLPFRSLFAPLFPKQAWPEGVLVFGAPKAARHPQTHRRNTPPQ